MFGILVDDLTMDSTVEEVERLVTLGRSTGRSYQVATVNVDFVVNALADADLHRILRDADLVLADGMPIVWAAKLAGTPVRERVAGSDLVPALAQRSASTGLDVHLFGSRDGVAETAAALLAERFPGCRVTADSGPMLTDPRRAPDEVIEGLRARNADVVCVAFGNPKQERFIDEYRARIGAPVMIGIGGSLDMLVGERRRAPRWAQRAGLEFVFRAAQEPGRLGRRYAHDARVFGPRLVAHARLARRDADARRLTGELGSGAPGHLVIRCAGEGDHVLRDQWTTLTSLPAETSLTVTPPASEAKMPRLRLADLATVRGLIRHRRQHGATTEIETRWCDDQLADLVVDPRDLGNDSSSRSPDGPMN
jgi:N-acetylglucosaminyldiphosphoundecaprenol N-acetyl-beta-D-mannosaminyltransferase